MATLSVTRTAEIPPLELRASFVPKTLDADKRTVQVTWTTGARVLRGFYEQYYEELSLDPKHVRMKRLQSGAPLLDTHRADRIADVIGVVESAELEAKRGIAWIRFDRGVEGEEAMRKVGDGILRNLSVGYRIHKMEKVEGGAGQIPVFRAVDWEPHELTLTAIGSDAGAVTRSESTTTNPCEFIEQDEHQDEHQEQRTMRHPVETPAAGAMPGTPNVPVPALDAAAIQAAERTRMLGIQRVGRALSRPQAEVDAAVNDPNMTLDAFRAAAVDALAAASPSDGGVIQFDRRHPRIDPGEDSRDKWLRGGEAWLIQRAAVSGIVGAAAKARGEKLDLDPGEYRGKRLIDFARQSLERDGVSTERMLPMDLIGKALTHRTGNATIGDFPILLENTLHKVMLAAYTITPDTWTRFCSRGSVSDFKPHKRYRMGTFGALSPLNESGEFENKAIPDGERQSQQADTVGNIIGISRKAIIDDDMGAFSTLATALGRAGKLSVEVHVFKLLALNAGLGPTMTDGLTLFHATHNNISTGAALSAAALDADRVTMGLQKDQSGNELLELRPAILLVPIGLGGQARVINDSQFDPDTVANKAQMKANIAGKMFNDIVDTGRIAGTRRYAFADPAIAPVIEVAFLDGQEAPFMEMKEGWRVDGVEWKIRLDFGAAPVDFRGAVTNSGA